MELAVKWLLRQGLALIGHDRKCVSAPCGESYATALNRRALLHTSRKTI